MRLPDQRSKHDLTISATGRRSGPITVNDSRWRAAVLRHAAALGHGPAGKTCGKQAGPNLVRRSHLAFRLPAGVDCWNAAVKIAARSVAGRACR